MLHPCFGRRSCALAAVLLATCALPDADAQLFRRRGGLVRGQPLRNILRVAAWPVRAVGRQVFVNGPARRSARRLRGQGRIGPLPGDRWRASRGGYSRGGRQVVHSNGSSGYARGQQVAPGVRRESGSSIAQALRNHEHPDRWARIHTVGPDGKPQTFWTYTHPSGTRQWYDPYSRDPKTGAPGAWRTEDPHGLTRGFFPTSIEEETPRAGTAPRPRSPRPPRAAWAPPGTRTRPPGRTRGSPPPTPMVGARVGCSLARRSPAPPRGPPLRPKGSATRARRSSTSGPSSASAVTTRCPTATPARTPPRTPSRPPPTEAASSWISTIRSPPCGGGTARSTRTSRTSSSRSARRAPTTPRPSFSSRRTLPSRRTTRPSSPSARKLIPRRPPSEWYAVDLIENRQMVGLAEADLQRNLTVALRAGRLDAARLQEMAARYGSRSTRALVQRAFAVAAGALPPKSSSTKM